MTHTNKGIIGLVDGDVLLYRACNKAIKDNLNVKNVFDNIYNDVKLNTGCEKYHMHISGKGNFRKDLKQSYTVYKGKRKNKPDNFRELKDYVNKKYKPISKNGFEADDTISIEATNYLNKNQLYMLITIDKDLKTIGGLFYNIMHNNLIAVSKYDAVAFFHEQLLTGDSVDNIPGIEGIGPVKAKKILKDKNLKEQFESILQTYKKYYKQDYRNRLEIMGKMLYLLKNENDNWTINYWKGFIKHV